MPPAAGLSRNSELHHMYTGSVHDDIIFIGCHPAHLVQVYYIAFAEYCTHTLNVYRIGRLGTLQLSFNDQLHSLEQQQSQERVSTQRSLKKEMQHMQRKLLGDSVRSSRMRNQLHGLLVSSLSVSVSAYCTFHCMLNCQYRTLNCQYRTLNCQYRTLNCQYCTLKCQYCTLHCQYCTLHCQYRMYTSLSDLCTPLSAAKAGDG